MHEIEVIIMFITSMFLPNDVNVFIELRKKRKMFYGK